MDNHYYVVEYRFPVEIVDARDVKDAARKAADQCEKIYGFRPSNWYARVFEYESGIENIGPVKEFFFNPQGDGPREVIQNHSKHEELVVNGENGKKSPGD